MLLQRPYQKRQVGERCECSPPQRVDRIKINRGADHWQKEDRIVEDY